MRKILGFFALCFLLPQKVERYLRVWEARKWKISERVWIQKNRLPCFYHDQWDSYLFFQECDSTKLQKDSPYMLFYQQDGMDERAFLPNFSGQTPDSASDDEEYENDVKKLCILQ